MAIAELGQARKQEPPLENGLFLTIPLAGGPFGGAASVTRVHGLEGALRGRLLSSDVAGRWDGNDFGMGEATIYLYGPDPHAMAAALGPTLFAAGLPVGSELTARINGVRVTLWELKEGGPPW